LLFPVLPFSGPLPFSLPRLASPSIVALIVFPDRLSSVLLISTPFSPQPLKFPPFPFWKFASLRIRFSFRPPLVDDVVEVYFFTFLFPPSPSRAVPIFFFFLTGPGKAAFVPFVSPFLNGESGIDVRVREFKALPNKAYSFFSSEMLLFSLPFSLTFSLLNALNFSCPPSVFRLCGSYQSHMGRGNLTSSFFFFAPPPAFSSPGLLGSPSPRRPSFPCPCA